MTIITVPSYPEIRIDEDWLNLRIDSLVGIPIDFYPSHTPVTAKSAVTSTRTQSVTITSTRTNSTVITA